LVRTTKVQVMLAQFAQVANGLVNMMGTGWTIMPPQQPQGYFLAGTIDMPWDAAGVEHNFRFVLLDDQGKPIENENGEDVKVDGQFNLAPAAGIPKGTPLTLPLAIPIGPLMHEPGARYEWRLEVNDETHEEWRLGYTVAREAQAHVS
jgi:hypothetical protein